MAARARLLPAIAAGERVAGDALVSPDEDESVDAALALQRDGCTPDPGSQRPRAGLGRGSVPPVLPRITALPTREGARPCVAHLYGNEQARPTSLRRGAVPISGVAG